MVLHELNNATKFADYLIGMKKGEVVFRGKPLDVITEENLLYTLWHSSKITARRNETVSNMCRF